MSKPKPGPFDAALSLLEGAAFAIRGHAKDREKALKDCREIANACIVLEGAAKALAERDELKAEAERLRGENAALSGAAELMIDEADESKAELGAIGDLMWAVNEADVGALAIARSWLFQHEPRNEDIARPAADIIDEAIAYRRAAEKRAKELR